MEHRAIVLAPQPPVRPVRRPGHPDRDGLLREHDIRGIAACLALVADELSGGRRREAVLGDRVRRACDRLLQLGGAVHPSPSAGDGSLTAILDDVSALAASLAGPRTRLEVDAPAAPVGAAAETALFRILLNLVANAVRAVNDAGGGVVRVRAALDASVATVEVVNAGAGLLLRSGGAPRPGARSGLGLVIAEALAADLGGRLSLHRSRRGTTTLRLVLPASVFSAAP